MNHNPLARYLKLSARWHQELLARVLLAQPGKEQGADLPWRAEQEGAPCIDAAWARSILLEPDSEGGCTRGR